MTPAPDTGRTAEKMRAAMARTICEAQGFDPDWNYDPRGVSGGPEDMIRWKLFLPAVDALLSGPLAPILQEAATARKERDEAQAEADGLRQMIRALAEMQKSARETEERHAQWLWDHPIVRGASTTAAEQEAAHLRAENANLRDRVREAEKGGQEMACEAAAMVCDGLADGAAHSLQESAPEDAERWEAVKFSAESLAATIRSLALSPEPQEAGDA